MFGVPFPETPPVKLLSVGFRRASSTLFPKKVRDDRFGEIAPQENHGG
jgi:hypothetical protein